jgi:hypothetical protein
MPTQCTCLSCGRPFLVSNTRARTATVKYCSLACTTRANTRPISQRAWAKVDQSAGPLACWPWTGSKNWAGYGQINPSRHGPGSKTRQAHRVIYELVRGPIPPGLHLDHLCRNRVCVNPAHLEPVTARENALRGRSPLILLHLAGACQRGHVVAGDNVYVHPTRGTKGCLRCCRDRGSKRPMD